MKNQTDEQRIPETEAAEDTTAEVTEAENTEAQDAKDTQEAPEALSELEQLRQDLMDAKEQYLRLAAEYDNFRKRTAKEKESIYGDAKVATYTAILPVLDNFERAFASEVSQLEDFKKGVEMTRDQLQNAFTQAGIEAYGQAGDPFDPNLHNAVMHGEDETFGENTVSEVFQKGYKMGDRILRHAMVKVVN